MGLNVSGLMSHICGHQNRILRIVAALCISRTSGICRQNRLLLTTLLSEQRIVFALELLRAFCDQRKKLVRPRYT